MNSQLMSLVRLALSIVLVMPVVALLFSGPAHSRLKKCPINQKQTYHICYGTYLTPNGNKYVGEWRNNKRHGRGTYTFRNGNKYVGEYKLDKWTGKGTLSYADGSKYEGEWLNDKYHGHGVLTYSNGEEFEGEWRYGKVIKKTRPVKNKAPSINDFRLRIEKLQKDSP